MDKQFLWYKECFVDTKCQRTMWKKRKNIEHFYKNCSIIHYSIYFVVHIDFNLSLRIKLNFQNITFNSFIYCSFSSRESSHQFGIEYEFFIKKFKYFEWISNNCCANTYKTCYILLLTFSQNLFIQFSVTVWWWIEDTCLYWMPFWTIKQLI